MAVTPPITTDLQELFPDTLLVAQRTGSDGGLGTFAYGEFVARPARISKKIQVIRDFAGQERVSHVQATLGGAFGVKVTDVYVLPSRYDPNVPKAISVEISTDENGPHHEVVYF